ncbi:MAG: tRNA (adenosine(37)-N6)-dimethylallyltransferase MiaA [Spirulinaceae cyanobacterium]
MLIVICGATATGKSRLGVELAQRLDSVIISADSRQVYRELDIGTAKPSQPDRTNVPHYLLDICEPTETLTLAEYQQKAQALIADFSSPLLVGGTGLYIKAIVRGLIVPRVAPQPQLRLQLEALGQTQLYSFLWQVDPLAANKIHGNDLVRTLRALEVFYVTGVPISKQQGENPPTYPVLQIGLDCDKEVLHQRIRDRTSQMLEAGLVTEVENLIEKYGWDLPSLNTLGYSEIKQFLAGKLSLPEAEDLIVLHTRQFAKRQKTWFRKYPEINWFEAGCQDLLEKVWLLIASYI